MIKPGRNRNTWRDSLRISSTNRGSFAQTAAISRAAGDGRTRSQASRK